MFSSTVSRSPSSVASSWASAAHAQTSIASGSTARGLGELDGGQAGRPGGAEVREQPKLDAQVHQPGVVEPGQAGDEVVEAFIELHRRSDCRTHGA